MQINWKFWQSKKSTQQEINRNQCRCHIEPPILYGIAMCEPDEYGYATVQISTCPPRSHTMPCGEKIQVGDLLQVRDGLLYKADTKEGKMKHHVFKMTQDLTGHGVFNRAGPTRYYLDDNQVPVDDYIIALMEELTMANKPMGNPGMCVSKHIFIGNGRYCEDCGHVVAADCHLPGQVIKYQGGGFHVVETPEWTDITNQCKPVLLKSKQHDGYYTRLVYKGVTILVQGMDTVAPGEFLDRRRFKIEMAKGAKFSFRIYERTGHEPQVPPRKYDSQL